MYRYVIVSLLIASARAQLVLEGPCNFTASEAVRNLNVSQFLGEWYQISRIDNSLEVGDCATSSYAGIVEGGVFINGTVHNREVVNETAHWNNGTFTPGLNGIYNFKYSDLTMDVLVLATDYTHYGLLYSCIQNDTHRTVWSWQIGRAKQFTTEQSSLISAAVSLNSDLRNATWRAVGQTDEHCKVNGAMAVLASPILVLLVLCNGVTKLF